jgi:hypothetical protein
MDEPIHQLEAKINTLIIPQVQHLQEQCCYLNETLLKLSVLLQSSDEREEQIIELLSS